MTTAPTRPAGTLAGAEYDALADLFLGDDSSRRPPLPQAAAGTSPRVGAETVTVEALILGHLPVLGAAWAMQYAREVSQRRGGWVGVISVRGGQVAVELVGASGQDAGGAAEGGESLEGAVRAGRRLTWHWLVRVEPGTESALSELDAVQRVTLLSGADEAAIVASYRTLKQVQERGGRALSVAIMGSAAAQAQEAVARLSKASEAFLGYVVPMAACVPAIGPGRIVSLYRAAIEGDATETIELALQCLRESPAGGNVLSPRSRMKVSTRSEHAAAPISAGEPGHPVLAGLIPGLTSVRARCPHAPGVEVAVDSMGSMHLLARHAADALGDLSAAGAWAVEHVTVLRLTPGCERVAEGAPVLHLFTERPVEVRRLLASAVRVHALARVGEAWAAIDLN